MKKEPIRANETELNENELEQVNGGTDETVNPFGTPEAPGGKGAENPFVIKDKTDLNTLTGIAGKGFIG